MAILFTNNASARLTSDISPVATTLQVIDASAFPTVQASAGDYFLGVLAAPDGTFEIVKVTERVGDIFTVTRGEEGTTPRSWQAGTPLEIRWTAGLASKAANNTLVVAEEISLYLKNDSTMSTTKPSGNGVVVTAPYVSVDSVPAWQFTYTTTEELTILKSNSYNLYFALTGLNTSRRYTFRVLYQIGNTAHFDVTLQERTPTNSSMFLTHSAINQLEVDKVYPAGTVITLTVFASINSGSTTTLGLLVDDNNNTSRITRNEVTSKIFASHVLTSSTETGNISTQEEYNSWVTNSLRTFPIPTEEDAGKALVVNSDGTVSWQPVATDPVGILKWYFGTTPPAGHVDLSNDNGLLLRSAYEAWEEIFANCDVRTETEWQAEFTSHGTVGFFSEGDGSTNFRVPLVRRVFVRAPDAASGLAVGGWQEDQFQGHSHKANSSSSLGYDAPGRGNGVPRTVAGTTIVSDEVHGAPRFGTETRPVNICLLPIMRMHHAVVSAANLDLEEFVQQVNSKLETTRYESEKQVYVKSPAFSWGVHTDLTWVHNLNIPENRLQSLQFRVDLEVTENYLGWAVGDILKGVLGRNDYNGITYYNTITPKEVLKDSFKVRTPTSFSPSGNYYGMGFGVFATTNSKIILNIWY